MLGAFQNHLQSQLAEIRAAVADIFSAFEQTGSAYGVVGCFHDRPFPRRAYGGAWAGEIRWGRLTHGRVLGILANPAYAGAYVFGRYRSRRTLTPDGTIRTALIRLPLPEWAVLIRDHHPGYISWERYLTNRERVAAHCTHHGARPEREGRALCQGIVRCGACGRGMTTTYPAGGTLNVDIPGFVSLGSLNNGVPNASSSSIIRIMRGSFPGAGHGGTAPGLPEYDEGERRRPARRLSGRAARRTRSLRTGGRPRP